MIPRDYQWEAVQLTLKYFETNKGNPIIAMPTGTGKSGVIAFLIRTILWHWSDQRILVLTHVKELIEQDFNAMMRVWPEAPAGIYSAGLNRRDIYQQIIFAGIGSIGKKGHDFAPFHLILIDEAHLVSNKDTTMYRKFIDNMLVRNPYLKVIGLTATAFRMGQGMLNEGDNAIFTDFAVDFTTMERFNWFIDQGYLCPVIPKQTNFEYDLTGVGTSGGDYVQKQLQNAVDKNDITERALKEAMESGHDRYSWLVFASGVDHAKHITDMLNHFGISAACVTGDMGDNERDQVIADFKKGLYRALVNNNVLTTGFDHPYIDLIVNLRPSKSPGLWGQIVGRGIRCVYADGFDLTTQQGRLAAIAASCKQNCLVLDFGGNTKRLGPINDLNIPNPKGKKKGVQIVKTCEVIDASTGKKCNTINHPSVRFCICCGAEFKFELKIKQAASTEQIIKSDLPIVEEFKVESITYSIHHKEGAPPMLKVSYFCGYHLFKDYVCVQHTGFAHTKARQWWRERSKDPLPATTLEAMELSRTLRVCTSLRVWTNKKYPEIMAYCYDGTHFGKEEPVIDVQVIDGEKPPVAPSVVTPDGKNKFIQALGDIDDDIPF